MSGIAFLSVQLPPVLRLTELGTLRIRITTDSYQWFGVLSIRAPQDVTDGPQAVAPGGVAAQRAEVDPADRGEEVEAG